MHKPTPHAMIHTLKCLYTLKKSVFHQQHTWDLIACPIYHKSPVRFDRLSESVKFLFVRLIDGILFSNHKSWTVRDFLEKVSAHPREMHMNSVFAQFEVLIQIPWIVTARGVQLAQKAMPKYFPKRLKGLNVGLARK